MNRGFFQNYCRKSRNARIALITPLNARPAQFKYPGSGVVLDFIDS